jgi:crossover junction endodeoxyribonuclease RusA
MNTLLMSLPLFPDDEKPIIGLVLPLPPSANRYWRQGGGRIYVSEEARSYREEVSLICYQKGIKPLSGTVSVSVNIYRAQRRGDTDNFLKIALDSLKHHCYADDDQIVQIIANRYDDKRNPRLEVTVQHYTPRPVKLID